MPTLHSGTRPAGFSRPVASADQPPMRWLRIVAVSTFAVFAGCLEFEQTVQLEADGRGTQHVRLVARESTLADLARAAAASQFGSSSTMEAVFDKDLVARELSTAGLALDAHAVSREGGKRTVDLTASFPAFDKLQKSPLAGGAAEWSLAPGPKAGTVKLTLYPQGKEAWQLARQKAEAMGTASDPVAEEFFRKRCQQLAGLDVVVRFRVPGDVLLYTANMEKTGDREVTARVTAEQIKTPQDLVRRLAPRFEVVFDGTGTTLLN
jgi:hypothetical protein